MQYQEFGKTVEDRKKRVNPFIYFNFISECIYFWWRICDCFPVKEKIRGRISLD